jgi:hypothetical protein
MIGVLLRRVLAIALAASLVLPPSPRIAEAKPGQKRSPDAEVAEVTQHAETLLDKLEYERARELLETAVLNPMFRKARPTWRAKLWALLGRARAEVGDTVGTDEAFLQAVQFDRRVKLAKGTSPKILDALERARLNAPLPGEATGPVAETKPEAADKGGGEKAGAEKRTRSPHGERTRTSTAPKTAVGKKPPAADDGDEEEAGGADARRGASKTEAAAGKAGESADKGGGEKRGREKKPKTPVSEDKQTKPETPAKEGANEPETKPETPAKPEAKPARKDSPKLRHRIEGRVAINKTITIVIEQENLPRGAHLELELRKGQTGAFKQEPLTKTGTVSIRKMKLDRPRLEFFVRALKGKKLITQLGSLDDPIIVSTLPPPPSLADAWSVEEQKVQLIPRTATATKASKPAAPPLAVSTPERAHTSTKTASPLPSVAPSSAPIAVVKPTEVKEEDDGSTGLIIGITAGAVALVAAGIVTFLIIKSHGTPECPAKEGFGCTQIQVVP